MQQGRAKVLFSTALLHNCSQRFSTPAALQAANFILQLNPGRCPRAVATIRLSAGKS